MDLEAFRATLDEDAPPAGLASALQALWCEARGDWHGAHDLCNRAGGVDGAWVHAYLHRVEGDRSNAEYWYRRAGRPRPAGTLAEEWAAIAVELLARP